MQITCDKSISFGTIDSLDVAPSNAQLKYANQEFCLNWVLLYTMLSLSLNYY